MSDFLSRTADLVTMYPASTGVRALPQNYCRDLTDHKAHPWPEDTGRSIAHHRCPGRYTPSNHRAPHASPAVSEDPFAGIPGADEDEEY